MNLIYKGHSPVLADYNNELLLRLTGTNTAMQWIRTTLCNASIPF